MNKIIEEDTIQIIKNNDMEKLRNSSFLITGASGMVGSYFVNTLIKHFSEQSRTFVLLLINKNTGYWLFEKNII